MADANEGITIQSMADLKKLPPEVLIEKITASNRLVQEEKRNSARKESELQSRIRLECDRLRSATSQHVRELEEQNTTLLKSLTRLQMENDKLKQEITTLQVRIEMGPQRMEEQISQSPVRALAEGSEVSPGTPLMVAAPGPHLGGGAIPEKLKHTPSA